MDDEPAGHEVMRGLLGEVEDVRIAGRLDGGDLVGELVQVRRHFGVELREGRGLRTRRMEADLALEKDP